MSQRGGVVSSHVRFGSKVWSPIIPEGRADALLAFEQAEALRALHLLDPAGSVISNTQSIIPPLASGKRFSYPHDALEQVKGRFPAAVCIDALAECKALGNEKMVSVLLLGALAEQLDFPAEQWERVIRSRVPKGTEDANLAAFRRGRELALATRASTSGI
jgi:indolepyruvate ferredoxin oxidoreductase beta subunit